MYSELNQSVLTDVHHVQGSSHIFLEMLDDRIFWRFFFQLGIWWNKKATIILIEAQKLN